MFGLDYVVYVLTYVQKLVNTLSLNLLKYMVLILPDNRQQFCLRTYNNNIIVTDTSQ